MTLHYNLEQPLKRLLFFLFVFATRKWVYVLFHCHLSLRLILLQLVLYVSFNRVFISAYPIHKLPSGPKVSALLVCLSVKYREAALSLVKSHEWKLKADVG